MKTPRFLLLLFLFLFLSVLIGGCLENDADLPADDSGSKSAVLEVSEPGSDLSLEEMYRIAVEDTKTIEEEEICSNLTPIIKSNENLCWSSESGEDRVLVVTWTKYKDSYPPGESITTWWGDTWVTAVPDIKEAIVKNGPGNESIEIRTAQLLGMPPNSECGWFAEFWVRPEDLFRPTPDPEVTDSRVELSFPEGTPEEHIRWFSELNASVYGNDGYPWTRLGYTYDWGSQESEIGVSEFVLKNGSEVFVESISTTGEYFTY